MVLSRDLKMRVLWISPEADSILKEIFSSQDLKTEQMTK